MLKGYDYFTPAIDTVTGINCKVCRDMCDVKRGVNDYISSVMAMAKIKTPHDSFTCPNSGKLWHDKALVLLQDIEKCNSLSIKKIMRNDLEKIIRDK